MRETPSKQASTPSIQHMLFWFLPLLNAFSSQDGAAELISIAVNYFGNVLLVIDLLSLSRHEQYN